MASHRLLVSSVSVVASGLLTLVPIGRAPRNVQVGVGAVLSIVPAVVVAAVAHRAVRDGSDTRRAVVVASAGAITAGVSAATWEASVRADRAIERALVRRRVRRPRLVMAFGSAALTAATEVVGAVLDRRRADV